jgi:hypothetical protein
MTLSDHQVRHLELIQGVIARHASSSFLVKGWSLTVAGLFYGFAVKELNWRVAAVALMPTVAFWWLDAYFLRQERLFRSLYEAVLRSPATIPAFSMDTRPYRGEPNATYRRTIFSATLVVLYGVILATGIAILVASLCHDDDPPHAARTSSATSSSIASIHG